MRNLSKRTQYSLRALYALARNHGRGPVLIAQMAREEAIPKKFLEQILLSLKHAGLLGSTRGVQGGYALIKPPSKVTLGQVIRILDGPLAPIACVSKTAYQKCLDCPYTKKAYCPLQDVMGGVRNAIAHILDNYSLKDFISGMHGSRRTPVRRVTAGRYSEN